MSNIPASRIKIPPIRRKLNAKKMPVIRLKNKPISVKIVGTGL
jgi:hypothetical protein